MLPLLTGYNKSNHKISVVGELELWSALRLFDSVLPSYIGIIILREKVVLKIYPFINRITGSISIS